MKRRQIALALAGILAASVLAGCDAGGAAAPAAAEETVEAAAPAEEEAAPAEEAAEEEAEAPAEEEAAPAEEAEAPAEWEGDVDEINVLLVDQRGNSESVASIADAMNEITEKTIGVRAHIQMSSFGEYNTQFGLQVASGESLDVASLGFQATGFSTLVANQQLTDLTDLLEENAPELLELMGDYLPANSVNGRILAIPPYRNYASANYLYMRNDILEELGLLEGAKDIDSWSGITEVWKKVKEETNLAPFGSGLVEAGIIYLGDKFEDYEAFDSLGDTYKLMYVDPDGKVSLILENENQKKQQDMMRQWWNDKLIWQDALISEEHVDEIIKAGVVFSAIQLSEMGVEAAKKAATGYEVTCIEVSKNLLTSSQVNKFGLCVPVTSEEPEAAVRWINALYTDPALSNLLDWGIEGRDYQILESGEIDYPEGADAQTVPYHEQDFFWGNYFAVHPWNGNGADFRQRAYDYLTSAPVSPYLGFAVDQSGITNLVSNINTVYMKYYKDIAYGAYTDEEWDLYVNELYAQGIQDYIDAYQEQLDAWKNAQ